MKSKLCFSLFAAACIICASLFLSGTTHAKTAPTAAKVWRDDFDSDTLNSLWRWIRQDPTHWSLTAKPGYLQITTEEIFTSWLNVRNLLVRSAPVGDYSIETKLEFNPTQNWQLAGLLIYKDDLNWLQIGRAYCTESQYSCVNDGVYFDYCLNGHLIEDGGIKLAIPMPAQPDVYLRITRHGNQYSGYMSLDGGTWTKVGDHTASFTPDRIGLKASNQAADRNQIPANFDYFALSDDSFYVYVPLVIR